MKTSTKIPSGLNKGLKAGTEITQSNLDNSLSITLSYSTTLKKYITYFNGLFLDFKTLTGAKNKFDELATIYKLYY